MPKTLSMTKKLPISMLPSLNLLQLMVSVTQYKSYSHPASQRSVPTNKSYSNGTYKDGTVHITIGAGHNNNHPSPINPDPYTHILGIAMVHYSDPDIVGAAFAQSYSFNAGLKKFGVIEEKAAMTELTQIHA
jgi:hypothetical protein